MENFFKTKNQIDKKSQNKKKVKNEKKQKQKKTKGVVFLPFLIGLPHYP